MKDLIRKILKESDLEYYGTSNATKDEYTLGIKENEFGSDEDEVTSLKGHRDYNGWFLSIET